MSIRWERNIIRYSEVGRCVDHREVCLCVSWLGLIQGRARETWRKFSPARVSRPPYTIELSLASLAWRVLAR